MPKKKSKRIPLFFAGILPLDRSTLLANLAAGFSLAAMNIPQAMGYAKIAGMPVITGLYTLLLPLVAFAAFGSSRYLVVASDSATAAILAGGLTGMAGQGTPEYVALAGLVALLTAVCLLLARLMKLGFLADFLSRTVLIGFLTGVGIQVGIAMLGSMLKLDIHGHNPVGQFLQITRELPRIHWPTASLSLAVVVAVLLGHRFAPRFPIALIAVIGSIAASAWWGFAHHGLSVVGPITGGLPHISLPPMTWELAVSLMPIAGSCFVMIVAQSSVTSRAYASRHNQSFDENRDLVGLSAANAAASLSGTFVVNGSPTQTAMVETAGGSNQIAHLSTAFVVLVVLLFFTGPLELLPMCVLAAIVFTIAVRLIDFKGLSDLMRKSRKEWILALVTTAAVVFLGVERGIILALVLSLLQHVRHSYLPSTSLRTLNKDGVWQSRPIESAESALPGLLVYSFGSDLFYANVDRFASEIRELVSATEPPIRWLVVDAGAITDLDYTAAITIRQLDKDLRKGGVTLYFVHVSALLRHDLKHRGLSDVVTRDRQFDTLRDCFAAYEKLKP